MPAVLQPPLFNRYQRDAVKDPQARRPIDAQPSQTNLFLTEVDGKNLQQTLNSSWTVGNTTDQYVYYYANVPGMASTPALRYNKILHRWEFDNGLGEYTALGAGGATGAKSYVHIQSVASDSWTIPHNLAGGIIYTLTDEFHYVIQPDEVEVIDENTISISFSVPVKGFCYILLADYTLDVSGSTWNIQHNLNTYQVSARLFGVDQKEFLPDQLSLIDENNLQVDFPSVAQGTINIGGIGYEYVNGAVSGDWTINHGLASRSLTYTVVDNTRTMIIPDEVILTNDSSIEVQFGDIEDGYVEIVEAKR